MQQQVLSLGGGDLLQDERQILRKIPHRNTAQRIGGRRLHLRDTQARREAVKIYQHIAKTDFDKQLVVILVSLNTLKC